jgi:ankyrin repeat protein
MLISNNNDTICVDVCQEHNEPYTKVGISNNIYCDKCDIFYNTPSIMTILDWKKQILIEMETYKLKLNNKINGLKCIIEMILDYKELKSVSKTFEDIIDTILIDISHVDNFIQLVNHLSISSIIKRKNHLLYNTNIIPQDIGNCIVNDGNRAIIEYVRRILRNDADINSCIGILHTASLNNRLSIVKCLIKYGIDVNNDSAIISASFEGNLDVVECLIKNGADSATPNLGVAANIQNKYEALREASRNGNLNVVKLLVKNGAMNDEALHCASRNGHSDIVNYLTNYK